MATKKIDEEIRNQILFLLKKAGPLPADVIAEKVLGDDLQVGIILGRLVERGVIQEINTHIFAASPPQTR